MPFPIHFILWKSLFSLICCLPALINHTLNLHLSVPRLIYLPTWLNVASLLRRGSIEIPVDVSDAGNKTSGGCITGTTSRSVWDTGSTLASPFSSISHSYKDALTVRTWWREGRRRGRRESPDRKLAWINGVLIERSRVLCALWVST